MAKASKGRHAGADKKNSSKASDPAKSSSTKSKQGASGAASAKQPQGSKKASKAAHAKQSPVAQIPQVVSPQSAVPFTAASSEASGAETPAKKRKVGKVLALLAGIVVALLILVYVVGAIVFSSRFMPHTTMGDVDISMQSRSEVEGILDTRAQGYSLHVQGNGIDWSISAEEAGVSIDSSAVVDSMLKAENQWLWPYEITQNHDVTDCIAAGFDERVLDGDLQEQIAAVNEESTAPKNARPAYDKEQDKFIVKPEELGTELDPNLVNEEIGKAFVTLTPELTLGDEVLKRPEVLSDDPRLAPAADKANALLVAQVDFTMAGEVAVSINNESMSSWVVFDEQYVPTLDEEKMLAWANEQGNRCSTLGNERTYTRADGKEITVEGGDYGWEVDVDDFVAQVCECVDQQIKGETREMPCFQSTGIYRADGGRDWGNRYCDVDLSEQHAYYYDDDGGLIWETDIITGIPGGDRETPTGVYSVNSKTSPQVLYTYEPGKKKPEKTTVQYWMPFVGNLIGLHDAWWQPGFGGDMYVSGYGSHGCVNLPSDKAAELYGIISVDDVVVVHW